MRKRRKTFIVPLAVLAVTALPLLLTPAVNAAADKGGAEPLRGARLYVPPSERDSYRQVTRLAWRGAYRDSAGLLSMVRTPQAVWYGDESPKQVERRVRTTARRTHWQGTLPVLALYDVPGRDCGSYSSGGAQSIAEYQAWIDAVAQGIGDREALIILEPDSLALLPSDCLAEENTDAAEEQGGTDAQSDAGPGGAVADAAAPAEGAQQTMAPAGTDGTAADAPTPEPTLTELPPLPDPNGPSASAQTAPTAQAPTPQSPPSLTPAAQAAEPQAPAADPTPIRLPSPDPDPAIPPLEDQSAAGGIEEPGDSTAEDDAQTNARYDAINYAVDVLSALGNTMVYLDAGHAGWHAVSSIVPRLVQAGIDEATGFALNVSHYQTDEANAWYGHLISACLAYVDDGGDPEDCAEQTWSRRHARAWLRAHAPADPSRMKHFVTDTSRNGRGPWTPRHGEHLDPQSWCNPPGRGLGARPTTRTGDPLQDAALWVKNPGESDGRCLRGTDGPQDPARGTVSPDAGRWFPEQALELVRYAHPTVRVRR